MAVGTSFLIEGQSISSEEIEVIKKHLSSKTGIRVCMYEEHNHNSFPEDFLKSHRISYHDNLNDMLRIVVADHRMKFMRFTSSYGVLIIDDDSFNTEIHRQYISKDGFSVVTAGNGEEGYEKSLCRIGRIFMSF